MALMLLGVYALLVFCIGVATRSRGVEAFYVNNRASSAWGVGYSIIVSCVGASATVGMIGLAFTAGTPAFWWLGAGAVGLSLLAALLARAVRRSEAYTLPHLAESMLGPQVRPVMAAVIVVVWTAILAAQFSALGKVLESLSGLPPLACLGIGFALMCGHTMSGQAAVMRADKLQALILLSALAVMLAWLSVQNPAWIQAVRFEAVNQSFPLETLFYYLVVVGANYLVCPMLFGRLLSARDERSAMLGGLIGAGGLAVCAALIVAVGLACRGLVPAETPGDAVLTSIISGVMPSWMHLVVSFALISAIVSSADSCLVTAATVCCHDLLGLQSPATRRVSVLALGVAGAAVSLWGKGILGFLLMAYDVFACGVVMPCVVGLLVSPSRNVAPRHACAAVALGGVLGLAAAITDNRVFNYTGMSVSAMVALLGVERRPLHAQ